MGHVPYTCPAPWLVVSAIRQQLSNKRKLKEEDKDEEEPPTKKPTLSTSRGRLYEITEEEGMDED